MFRLLRALCLGGLFLFIGLFSNFAFAQAQKATVMEDGALIYKDPDFDAPVISTVKAGAVYDISKSKRGAFYKIRLKPGVLGWISDVDIRLGVVKNPAPKKKAAAVDAKKERKPKTFLKSRYRGPSLDYVNYTEDTLGAERSAGLLFYGFKINGYNTMFTGEIYTEANIAFHFGAPAYYSDLTKKSAEGFILMTNFLFQTVLPQSKWHLLYYGFGPMFKYSHFDLQVPNGTKTISYSANDMTLGAVFDLGLAFRVGDLSLRTDVKYYWERDKYYSVGLNLGWPF